MPSAQNDWIDLRQIEPFAHCQGTHSRFSKKFGTSRVLWLSGTASWAHYTATHYILGLRPEVGGVRIEGNLLPLDLLAPVVRVVAGIGE